MKRVFQVFLLAALATPHAANASCDKGAPSSYDDANYVRVAIYSLAGQLHPWFTYQSWSTHVGNSDHSTATLVAHRATRFRGQREAVDPKSSFHNVIDVLKRNSFFEMRLHQSSAFHLDGPEDEILVGHCGVETMLTTLPSGGNPDLNDNQGQALFHLERDLQDTIFAQQWRLPQEVRIVSQGVVYEPTRSVG